MHVPANLVRSACSSEEVGGIPKDVGHIGDVSQSDLDLLLGPSQLGRQAFVLYFRRNPHQLAMGLRC